jgi:hypothetical protein
MPNLEDSPDLTDEEVAAAVDATDAELGNRLFDLKCRCDRLHERRHNSLRRRRPYHYAIFELSCPVCGDAQKAVFRLTDPKWRLT